MMISYWNAIGIFLTDTLSFCLALLERVLVLELGTHDGGLSGKVWKLDVDSKRPEKMGS